MNELPSTEFRKTFARLSEPTVVTANGHVIGHWVPAFSNEPMWVRADSSDQVLELVEAPKSAQAKRDDLLRKINRG